MSNAIITVEIKRPQNVYPFIDFGPHFDLYQSLNRLPIWNSQNCSMFPLAFVAGWLQGHWWGFISRNYVVWPIFLLMNVFIALKGSHFWFLFSNMLLILHYEGIIGIVKVSLTALIFSYTFCWTKLRHKEKGWKKKREIKWSQMNCYK